MKLTNFYKQLKKEVITEMRQQPNITDTDKKVIDFLGLDDINEADGNKIITKLIQLIDSGKKGLITAAVIAALTSSAAFNSAYAQAPANVKGKIENALNKSGQNGKKTMTPGTKASNSLYSDSFSNNFTSGSYDLNPQEIVGKLENLKKFLAAHQNGDFQITVTASESQVPNQGGFKVKELASARAKSLISVIQDYLASNGVKNVTLKPVVRVGDVAWDGQNKDDQKYTKDQFVKMDVSAVGSDPAKMGFTKKGGRAEASTQYVDTTQTVKGKVNVKLSPGWIPDRLVITSKDGKILSDTGFFVDKVNPNYKNYNYVPEYVANLTKMYMSAPNSLASQNLIKKSFNSFDELKSFLISSTQGIPNDQRSETGGGLKTLESLFNNGQREFVFYYKDASKSTVSHQFNPGEEGILQVLSPVQKTEYTYSGTQEVNGQVMSLNSGK